MSRLTCQETEATGATSVNLGIIAGGGMSASARRHVVEVIGPSTCASRRRAARSSRERSPANFADYELALGKVSCKDKSPQALLQMMKLSATAAGRRWRNCCYATMAPVLPPLHTLFKTFSAAGDHSFTASITEEWMQGRTTYGGLSAGICFDGRRERRPARDAARIIFAHAEHDLGRALAGRCSLCTDLFDRRLSFHQ